MAFTNGLGHHIPIEMSANNTSLGGGHSYPYQEAAFYGNVFSDPPKAFFCVGKDFFSVGSGATQPELRACSGYTDANGNPSCPYVNTGACNFEPRALLKSRKCLFWNGAATVCTDEMRGFSFNSLWMHPITTYRLDKTI